MDVSTTQQSVPSKRKRSRAASERDHRVAERLREAREAQGLTKRWLADQIGCTYQQLQKYEAGKDRIPAGRLHSMARALGIDEGWFFRGEEYPGRMLVRHAEVLAIESLRTLPPNVARAFSDFVAMLASMG